jgi:hypothetical protein
MSGSGARCRKAISGILGGVVNLLVPDEILTSLFAACL